MRLPISRTLPSTRSETLRREPISRASSPFPLKANAEVREAALQPGDVAQGVGEFFGESIAEVLVLAYRGSCSRRAGRQCWRRRHHGRSPCASHDGHRHLRLQCRGELCCRGEAVGRQDGDRLPDRHIDRFGHQFAGTGAAMDRGRSTGWRSPPSSSCPGTAALPPASRTAHNPGCRCRSGCRGTRFRRPAPGSCRWACR